MRSIGNDIVALNTVNKQRTNDIRFQSKFITDAEQALYCQLPAGQLPFESYVWLLWSVKESAYKYLKRLDAELVFSPTKIIVQGLTSPVAFPVKSLIVNTLEGVDLPDTFYQGVVVSQLHTLTFYAVVYDDFVMSIVNDTPSFKNIYWGVQLIDDVTNENQSRRVRDLLLNKLKSMYTHERFFFKKSPVGYPILTRDNENTDIVVSFAHHQQFVTYCFKLP